MKQETTLVNPNIGVLGYVMQSMIQDGWEISPNGPLTQLGWAWEVTMVRDPSEIQLAKDAAEAAKPSRAEILAKARAEKARKAEERKEDTTNV